MSLLVTGSIGIDTVKSPFGEITDCLGGSVTYFSMAASFFHPVRFVGVVGEDCPFDLHEVFAGRDVDLTGLEIRQGSKTFRWAGTYHDDVNERTTDSVELNVLGEDPPPIPDAFLDSDYVFLANTHPALQIQMIEQLQQPRLIVADTMNLWIETERPNLLELLSRIHGLVLNDGEARMLTEKQNLITAAREIIAMGPAFVVIKKGEHGAILLDKSGDIFVLPAFPAEFVKDPTGAGDSFAGGMMGIIAREDNIEMPTLKKALAYGTAAASLVIEDFSLNRWKNGSLEDINKRTDLLKTMLAF